LILWAVRIATTPRDGNHAERYRRIAARLWVELQSGGYQPEVAGVEDQRSVIVGATRRGQTNADALHGLILQGLFHGWLAGIPDLTVPVHEVQTQAAKMALCGRGGGRASKEQIRLAVFGLPREPDVKPKLSEHAADAVGIALAAINVERQIRLGLR
jgi:Holliday junction resolvasome RuvABC endonuclease subunit